MNTLEVIKRMANPEGFPVSQDAVAQAALEDIQSGVDLVFAYGDVVFTVGVHNKMVHLYSLGTTSLLKGARAFARDVFAKTDHDFVWAPMVDKKLMSAAERFGWRRVGRVTRTGHEVYALERTKQ